MSYLLTTPRGSLFCDSTIEKNYVTSNCQTGRNKDVSITETDKRAQFLLFKAKGVTNGYYIYSVYAGKFLGVPTSGVRCPLVDTPEVLYIWATGLASSSQNNGYNTYYDPADYPFSIGSVDGSNSTSGYTTINVCCWDSSNPDYRFCYTSGYDGGNEYCISEAEEVDQAVYDAAYAKVAAMPAYTPYYDAFYAMYEPYKTAMTDHAGEYFQLAASGDAVTDLVSLAETAATNAQAGTDMTETEYNTAVAALSAAIVYPSTGYYRMKSNYYSNYYMYATTASLKAMESENDNSATTVVYLEETDATNHTYTLKMQNGFFTSVSQSQQVSLVETGTPASLTAVSAGPGYGAFTTGSQYGAIHCDAGKKIVGWETTAAASWWVLEDATDLTLSLNDGGDGSYYATTYLPFDVTLTNDVTAYVMTLNETKGVAEITSIGQSVPAGTPVLLKSSTVSSVSPAIATGLGSNNVTNALAGNYLSTTLTSGQLTLGMADNKVGFYTLNGTLPANRAYLTVPSSIRSIFFEEDEVTGINGVDANAAVNRAAVYDLQGRRVNATQRGGVYIINGKKVVK